MKHFAHLFRKEHLAHRSWLIAWIAGGLVWFLCGLAELHDRLPALTSLRLADFAGGLALAVGVVTVARVFQSEPVHSPHAFSRTRPPGAAVIVSSQILFILLWGMLWPALLRGSFVLLCTGSASSALTTALVTAGIAALILLPLMVLATIASGITEFAGELIVALVLFALGMVFARRFITAETTQYSPLNIYWTWPEGGSPAFWGTFGIAGLVAAWWCHFRHWKLAVRICEWAGCLFLAVPASSIYKAELPRGFPSQVQYETSQSKAATDALLTMRKYEPEFSWWPAIAPPGSAESSRSARQWRINQEISLPLTPGSEASLGKTRYRILRADTASGWQLEALSPVPPTKAIETIPVLFYPEVKMVMTPEFRTVSTTASNSLRVVRRVLELDPPQQPLRGDSAARGLSIVIGSLTPLSFDREVMTGFRNPFPKPANALMQRFQALSDLGGRETPAFLGALTDLIKEIRPAAPASEGDILQQIADLIEILRCPQSDKSTQILIAELTAAAETRPALLAAALRRYSDIWTYGSSRLRLREHLMEALHRAAGPDAVRLLVESGQRHYVRTFVGKYGWAPADAPVLADEARESLPPAGWLPDVFPLLAKDHPAVRWTIFPERVRSSFEEIKALATLPGYPWAEAAEFLWVREAWTGGRWMTLQDNKSFPSPKVLRALSETGIPEMPQRWSRLLSDEVPPAKNDIPRSERAWRAEFPELPLEAWLAETFSIPAGQPAGMWLREHADALQFDPASGRWR